MNRQLQSALKKMAKPKKIPFDIGDSFYAYTGINAYPDGVSRFHFERLILDHTREKKMWLYPTTMESRYIYGGMEIYAGDVQNIAMMHGYMDSEDPYDPLFREIHGVLTELPTTEQLRKLRELVVIGNKVAHQFYTHEKERKSPFWLLPAPEKILLEVDREFDALRRLDFNSVAVSITKELKNPDIAYDRTTIQQDEIIDIRSIPHSGSVIRFIYNTPQGIYVSEIV